VEVDSRVLFPRKNEKDAGRWKTEGRVSIERSDRKKKTQKKNVLRGEGDARRRMARGTEISLGGSTKRERYKVCRVPDQRREGKDA